jgi:hypothetical protein
MRLAFLTVIYPLIVTAQPSLPQVAREGNFASINRLNLREAWLSSYILRYF